MHSPVARVLAGLAATFALALGGIVAVPAAPATPAYQCSHFVLYKGWQGSCVRHLQTLLRGPDNLSSTVWTGGLAVDAALAPSQRRRSAGSSPAWASKSTVASDRSRGARSARSASAAAGR